MTSPASASSLMPSVPAGTHRQDHVAHVRGAVVDPDVDAGADLGPELGQHPPGLAYGAAAVAPRLVPVRRTAEQKARVARAQSAHHDIVGLGGVLHHQDRDGTDIDPELRRGGLRIGQQPLAKAIVDPGSGHEPRTLLRVEAVHALDLGPHVVSADDPLVHEEGSHRHLHHLVVGEGGVFEIRLGRVMMGRVHVVAAVPVLVRRLAGVFVSAAHGSSPSTGSSQCS